MNTNLLNYLRLLDDDDLLSILSNNDIHHQHKVDAAYIVAIERGISKEVIDARRGTFSSSVQNNMEMDTEKNGQESYSKSALSNPFNPCVTTPIGTKSQIAFETKLIEHGIPFHKQKLSPPLYRYHFHPDDIKLANFIYYQTHSIETNPKVKNNIRWIRLCVGLIGLIMIVVFALAISQ